MHSSSYWRVSPQPQCRRVLDRQESGLSLTHRESALEWCSLGKESTVQMICGGGEQEVSAGAPVVQIWAPGMAQEQGPLLQFCNLRKVIKSGCLSFFLYPLLVPEHQWSLHVKCSEQDLAYQTMYSVKFSAIIVNIIIIIIY